ncbi:MAG: metal ABC transporter substrate-binding protein [Clostridia bacterium]
MKKILCILFSALLMLSGCGPKRITDSGKLKIVSTLFPTYDFARAIAGDRADITLLLTPGKESHSYEPSTGDVIEIDGCDIFIFTGEYMEPWAEGLIEGLDNSPTVVDASGGITLDREEEHEEHEEHHHEAHEHEFDPHIWTSPRNCLTIVDSILEAMILEDGENADYYRKNAADLKDRLNALDREFREIVSESTTKKIYHGGRFSMYYFVKEYGLEWEAAYDSCSSDTEPSVRRICEMIDEMKEDGAKVVFYEELSNNSVAKLIADETGAEPLLLHSCHNLTQQEWDSGETYLSLMKKNAENLREALK